MSPGNLYLSANLNFQSYIPLFSSLLAILLFLFLLHIECVLEEALFLLIILSIVFHASMIGALDGVISKSLVQDGNNDPFKRDSGEKSLYWIVFTSSSTF